MVEEILRMAGIPYRESRFPDPPDTTFAVYLDNVEASVRMGSISFLNTTSWWSYTSASKTTKRRLPWKRLSMPMGFPGQNRPDIGCRMYNDIRSCMNLPILIKGGPVDG